MNATDIHLQMISLTTPNCEQFSATNNTTIARTTNDKLTTFIAHHPNHYTKLTTLAPINPKTTADKLKHCVTKLGFHNTKINSHIHNTYLNDPHYLPL